MERVSPKEVYSNLFSAIFFRKLHSLVENTLTISVVFVLCARRPVDFDLPHGAVVE